MFSGLFFVLSNWLAFFVGRFVSMFVSRCVVFGEAYKLPGEAACVVVGSKFVSMEKL